MRRVRQQHLLCQKEKFTFLQPSFGKLACIHNKLTYTGEEQTGVDINPSYAGTLTGHKATEAGTYTARASLNKGYIWSDGTTEDKDIVWTIAKADRDGPRGLRGICQRRKVPTMAVY